MIGAGYRLRGSERRDHRHRGLRDRDRERHADVVSVTLRTPRDIRTLVPSPHAHVIHAVYAGDFGAGRIVAVAPTRDGTKRRLSTSVGF
jgi:hypothetical protein